MRIAVVAPFEEPVPPITYGGTELVVYNLIEALKRLGHEVTLLASGDSKTSVELMPIFPHSLRGVPEFKDQRLRDSYKLIGVGRVVTFLKENKFDIIHNHIRWRLLAFETILSSPCVTTLHESLEATAQQQIYREYKKASYISISQSQRHPMPELNYIANVYNGIDMTKFHLFPESQDYFAFLGRMSPEKGPVQAIQIAKKAGVKLIMAGKVDVVDDVFFKREVEPLIDNEQIQFIGEVDHTGKLQLLGNARALIAPIQWEEPFGLFFVEAMACGTPVIAMRRGSVPELIVDEVTGFICQSNEEATSRVAEVGKLNRQDCFDHVNQHFSSEKMAEGYIAAYRGIIHQS